MPSCVVADSCSSRSNAPAWECSAAAPAARHSHPAPALAVEARRWSVGTCSHAGAWEREDDLSLNRYREVEHVHAEHAAPTDIIRELREIEAAISAGLTRLEGMLG